MFYPYFTELLCWLGGGPEVMTVPGFSPIFVVYIWYSLNHIFLWPAWWPLYLQCNLMQGHVVPESSWLAVWQCDTVLWQCHTVYSDSSSLMTNILSLLRPSWPTITYCCFHLSSQIVKWHRTWKKVGPWGQWFCKVLIAWLKCLPNFKPF